MGFDEQLTRILFDVSCMEYIEDQEAVEWGKAAIRTLIEQEVIGEDEPLPKIQEVWAGDPSCIQGELDKTNEGQARNALRAEQRRKLGVPHTGLTRG